MNLKRYIDGVIVKELKRHCDIDKSGVVSAYNKINSRIASEIKGGNEIARFAAYAFKNKMQFVDKDKYGWDGVYAHIMGLVGFLNDHKRYEPEWAKSQRASDLIRETKDLANQIKRSFDVSL